MIGDLIAACLFRNKPLLVGHTDNVLKHANYLSRVRDFHAANPGEYNRRFIEGLAVQKRARQGRKVNLSNVLKLKKITQQK